MKRGVGVLLILIILCAAGLFYSATVWKSKVHEAAETKPSQTVPKEQDSSNKDTASEQPIEDVVTKTPTTEGLSKTSDPRMKELFTKKFTAEEDVQMLVIGSDSLDPVAIRFATAFKETFSDWVTVDSVTADLTSTEFVAQGLSEIDWSIGYDIVLYEPFTLKNNGVVVIEREQQDLLAVQKKAMEANDQVLFIVTPPQPIYEANYYQTQIQALKTFTNQEKLMYIDHWSNWPPTNSTDLLNYVDKERQLTSRGVKVWSDALIHTFLK